VTTLAKYYILAFALGRHGPDSNPLLAGWLQHCTGLQGVVQCSCVGKDALGCVQEHLLRMLGALREYIHDEANKIAIQRTICEFYNNNNDNTLCLKKTRHFFYRNFGKCEPIILSQPYS